MELIYSRADNGASQHSTGQTGPVGEGASEREAAADKEAAREARNMARLNHLELLRNIGMEIAAGLGHAAAGRNQFNTEAFARVADPAASFNRIALAIRRIVALEDRLDEDAATRAARLAEEKAAEARKAARESLMVEKRIVRRAVREACKDTYPDWDRKERENLLDDLFRDYDDYNNGPLAEVVASICTDLGIAPDMTLWEDAPKEGEEPDPVKLKAFTLEMAEEYLELVTRPAVETLTAAPANLPGNEGGRGPPDG